jgi:hypothetical protein
MADQTDPAIKPDRARLSMTVTMTVAAAVGLVSATATGVGVYYQNTGKIAGLEARIGDMPTREDLTEHRRETEVRMRWLLEHATWWCPPPAKRSPATWVECRASFESYPAPPKQQR